MKLSVVLLAALAAPAAALAHPPHGEDFTIHVPELGPGRVRMFGMAGQGRLGLQLQSLTPDLRKFFGAPEKEGVLVSHVVEGSPAAKAGFRAGDVLLKVGDRTVDDAADVVAAVADRKEGDKVPVVILRDRQRYTLGPVLEKPALPQGFEALRGGGELREQVQRLERQVRELEERLKKLERR